jgi:hypothetical protein
VLAHGSQIGLACRAEPPGGHLLLEQPQRKQGRVALIHVVGPDVHVAQSAQHLGAT